MLALEAPGRVTLLGRHAAKMALVTGLAAAEAAGEGVGERLAGEFDLVVEATGAWTRAFPWQSLCAFQGGALGR